MATGTGKFIHIIKIPQSMDSTGICPAIERSAEAPPIIRKEMPMEAIPNMAICLSRLIKLLPERKLGVMAEKRISSRSRNTIIPAFLYSFSNFI